MKRIVKGSNNKMTMTMVITVRSNYHYEHDNTTKLNIRKLSVNIQMILNIKYLPLQLSKQYKANVFKTLHFFILWTQIKLLKMFVSVNCTEPKVIFMILRLL